MAYILRREGKVEWVDLGDAASIEAEIARFRTAVASSKSTNAKETARALDEKVMRSVRKLLGDGTLLLISPDGALNLVPFNALVDEQNRYLVERYTITYLTSGRDLLRMQVPAEGGNNLSAPLIVANPSFDQMGDAIPAGNSADNSRAFNLRQVTFKPLPGTDAEAEALSSILPGAQILTGTRATEEAIKLARAPIILHIATHGFFLPDEKENARAATARRRGLGLSLTDALQPQAVTADNRCCVQGWRWRASTSGAAAEQATEY
jgi:CHAT domain-containing protein